MNLPGSASANGSPIDVPPLITLRDMVVFPHTVKPFVVGRPVSIAALETSLSEDGRVFLLLQKDPLEEAPELSDLYRMGVVARVTQSLPLPNGHFKVLVEGLYRGKVEDFLQDASIVRISYRRVRNSTEEEVKAEELSFALARQFDDFIQKNKNLFGAMAASSFHPEKPGAFADYVASQLELKSELKQRLLDTAFLPDRLTLLNRLIKAESKHSALDQRLNREVEKQIEKAQKEYFLNEKMKLIRKELGREDSATDIERLKERIKKIKLPEQAMERAMAELTRLEAMPPISAEATVARSYIDWILALPWSRTSRDNKNIGRAQKILDRDHYGLEKVKERILEFLSVKRLAKNPKGNILCFVGPPGVGKTSVAKSIAKSMGRQFVRLSLGGVHDEAEIKGHRRTYIGAFPGQIIQLLKRAGTANPVFLLDEIDKLGADFRGDPASALLEVLDHEQNGVFEDHYIDVPFDLSQVLFITTANVTHPIPPALLDRLEVIPFTGYTLPEKLSIAEGYLIPKQLKAHGLRERDMDFPREGLAFLADGYTREAGVRNLEREIATLCRKVAHKVVREGRRSHEVLTPERVEALIGVPRYKERKALLSDEVGVAVGLAWTQVGGDILLIEASLMRGRGNLTLTGQLGDVMQESAKAVFSFIKVHVEELGLSPTLFKESDVHIHVPEGAIPKDGPSAGVSLAAAMVSAFTGVPVRHEVAMTGEATLRGKVLPVGGLKEKILAAKQHDIFTVVLPKGNERDISEIPEGLREGMTFHFVENLREVMALVLVDKAPSVGAAVLIKGERESRQEKHT